jgi:hypothetical protein
MNHGHFTFFRNANIAFSSTDEAQDYFVDQGLADGVSLLENLIRRLDEAKDELQGDSQANVRATFEGLPLHPRMAEACVQLYRDGHFVDAVLRAALALENYVKERSGRDDPAVCSR